MEEHVVTETTAGSHERDKEEENLLKLKLDMEKKKKKNPKSKKVLSFHDRNMAGM